MLFQLADHFIEGFPELLKLVVALYSNLGFEIPLSEPTDRGGQLFDWHQDSPDLDEAEKQNAPERKEHDEDEKSAEISEGAQYFGFVLEDGNCPSRRKELGAQEKGPVGCQVPGVLPDKFKTA
jgi:hypothetical protein